MSQQNMEFDIVIVGSGAGGGTVAKELSVLCKQGLKIALLELGPRLTKEQNTREELPMARQHFFNNGGFQTASQDMTLAFAKGVGGSTNVYTGVTFKLPESAVKKWNVPGITLQDLNPRMDKYIEENNVHLEKEQNINVNNQLFKKGCENLNWHVDQLAINTKHCQGLNTCNLGCPIHAKQGTAVVQIPLAEKNGVRVISNCKVERIESNPDGHVLVASISGNVANTGCEYRINAKKVILSAGAINTPALLMRSFGKKFNPVIGRYLTCHPALIMAAEHNELVNGMQGPPKNYYSDEFVETQRFLLESCMYFPFSFSKNLMGFGSEVDEIMNRYPYLQMALMLILDDAHAHNRTTIDKNGNPVVHYKLDETIQQAFINSLRACAKLVFAAGATRAHLPGSKQFFISAEEIDNIEALVNDKTFKLGQVSVNSAHLMGGCRMGEDPKTSVTNSWGKVHGVDHLYVADASLFPSCSEVNPYLTIMALADRVAQGIKQDINKG